MVTELRSRGITTGIKGKIDDDVTLDLSSIEPCHPAAIGKRVHLVEGALIWPVLFLYPEYGETDFIQEFHEDSRFVITFNSVGEVNRNLKNILCSFVDHLEIMFEETPLWDLEKKYNPTSIRLYYENRESGKLYTIDPHLSLKEVLSQKT